jgi:hypothetical protein
MLHEKVRGKYTFSVLDAEPVSWATFESRAKARPGGDQLYTTCKEFSKTTVNQKGQKGITITVYPALNNGIATGGPYFLNSEEVSKTEVNEDWQNRKYKYLQVCHSSSALHRELKSLTCSKPLMTQISHVLYIGLQNYSCTDKRDYADEASLLFDSVGCESNSWRAARTLGCNSLVAATIPNPGSPRYLPNPNSRGLPNRSVTMPPASWTMSEPAA